MVHKEIRAMMTYYELNRQDIADALALSLSATDKKLNGLNGWWLDEAIIIKNLFVQRGHDEGARIEDIFGLTDETRLIVGQ